MSNEYYTDYPTEPIGSGNPYHCCKFCKVPDPQINGCIEKHADGCTYRKFKKLYPEVTFSEFNLDCIRYHGRILTGVRKHYCYDWDMLPIDETCGEFECCSC